MVAVGVGLLCTAAPKFEGILCENINLAYIYLFPSTILMHRTWAIHPYLFKYGHLVPLFLCGYSGSAGQLPLSIPELVSLRNLCYSPNLPTGALSHSGPVLVSLINMATIDPLGLRISELQVV